MTRIIAVASGKGGVGKTTVSINLCNALMDRGVDVTVVDADLMNPNISLYLGHDKVGPNLHSVLKGENSISESIYSHPSGIKVIPASISLSDISHSDYSKLRNVLSGIDSSTDVVILDTNPSINQDAQELFRIADEMIVVTSPDLIAVTDAMKTIRVARAFGTSIMGVVLNRVEGKSFEMKTGDIESFLEVPVIGKIPEDRNIKKSAAENMPAYYLYPKSLSSREFRNIASNLIGEEVEEYGFFRDIMKIFGKK